MISHDEHLVSSICGELWVAEPGRVSIYKGEDKGEISPFEQWRARERKKGPTTGPGAAKVAVKGGGKSKAR